MKQNERDLLTAVRWKNGKNCVSTLNKTFASRISTDTCAISLWIEIDLSYTDEKMIYIGKKPPLSMLGVGYSTQIINCVWYPLSDVVDLVHIAYRLNSSTSAVSARL